jgi:hypothetical protein
MLLNTLMHLIGNITGGTEEMQAQALQNFDLVKVLKEHVEKKDQTKE